MAPRHDRSARCNNAARTRATQSGRTVGAAALGLLLGIGCGVSFPDEALVEDLRILEVRAEPPEIPFFLPGPLPQSAEDFARLRPNLAPVTFSALVAHPDLDATFGYEWIRCKEAPAEPGAPATGFDRVPCGGDLRVSLGGGATSSIAISPVQILFEDLVQSGGNIAPALASLVEDPRDLFSGLYARFNLRATVEQAALPVDTTALEASKRLVLFDPAVVALVLNEARRIDPAQIPMIEGLELPNLCTQISATKLSGLLSDLQARTPNRRPRYRYIEYLEPLGTATVAYLPGDAPIELAPGDSLVLRGRTGKEDRESYEVIDDNCNLAKRRESLVWSWFTNRGEIKPRITFEADAATEDEYLTTYTAPLRSELEQAETRVRIWSVLRDGRGGSDARQLEIIVRQ